MAKLLAVDPSTWGSPAYWDTIGEAAALIQAGGLVGFPTETVYGLAADALNPAAVARVFEVKQRPLDSPLILHLDGPDQVHQYVTVLPDGAARLMAAFWPGPLTLICRRAPVVPDITAGGRDNIGLRVPDHRVARDLVSMAGRPVVGPSANRSGRPSPMVAGEVLEELGPAIDAVLDAGPTQLGMESTVLDLTVDPPLVLRPGSVTVEELRRYLDRVEVAAAATGDPGRGERGPAAERQGLDQAPLTAPRRHRLAARLLLLDTEPGPGALVQAVRVAQERLAGGLVRRVGLLALGELQPGGLAHGVHPVSLGDDLRQAAARYYPALRELEAAGVDLIIACPLPRQGLGLAIMSRLEKTADEVVRL